MIVWLLALIIATISGINPFITAIGSMRLFDKNREINRSLDLSSLVLRGKIAIHSDVLALRHASTQDAQSAKAFMCGLCNPVSLSAKSSSMTQARCATPQLNNLILIPPMLHNSKGITHLSYLLYYVGW